VRSGKLFLDQAIDAFEIFTGHSLDTPTLAALEASLGAIARHIVDLLALSETDADAKE